MNPYSIKLKVVFFFPPFVCLFFSPSLHIHEKLTNSGTCPSMLSSRAHSFNTFSTNLDLFPQPDKELLASWGAFWHKASQLKALKKNFSQCCVDTDLHGSRVSFAHVLCGSESSLTKCGRAAERRHHRASLMFTCQRGEAKVSEETRKQTPSLSSSTPANAQPLKRYISGQRCVCCWFSLPSRTPASVRLTFGVWLWAQGLHFINKEFVKQEETTVVVWLNLTLSVLRENFQFLSIQVFTLLCLVMYRLAATHLQCTFTNICPLHAAQIFFFKFIFNSFQTPRESSGSQIFLQLSAYSVSLSGFQIPEEHDLESQVRMERQWRFLRNTRVRRQSRAFTQRGWWHPSPPFHLLTSAFQGLSAEPREQTEPGVPFFDAQLICTYINRI